MPAALVAFQAAAWRLASAKQCKHSELRTLAKRQTPVRRCFQEGCVKGQDADLFVEDMKKAGIRVPGIGHRIKSKVRALSPRIVHACCVLRQGRPDLEAELLHAAR